MGRYEDRVMTAKIVAVISVVMILALALASIGIFLEDKKTEPVLHTERLGDYTYRISLTYNEDMVGGTVHVTVTDADHTLSGDVSVAADGNDGHTVTGTFKTDVLLAEQTYIEVRGELTNVYSVAQFAMYATVLAVIVPLSVLLAMTAIRGFTVSVRRYDVGGNEVTVYCGMMRHELTVWDQKVAEMNTPLPFMKARMTHVLADGLLVAEASMMNHPTVSYKGYIVKELGSDSAVEPRTENDITI